MRWARQSGLFLGRGLDITGCDDIIPVALSHCYREPGIQSFLLTRHSQVSLFLCLVVLPH